MSEGDSSTYESDEDQPEYEVERILAEHVVDGKSIYLVKWLNYDDAQCTWEPAESFSTPATLADWKQQLENNDTFDEHEIARVQERMDAFQRAEEERTSKEHNSQSATKRHRESPLPEQSPIKRSRRTSPTAPSKSPITKKGIARLVSPKRNSTQPSTGQDSQKDKYPPRLSTASASKPSGSQIKPSKSAGPNRGDSITEPSHENENTNQVPARKSSTDYPSTSQARVAEEKVGQRFHSLRHQNNYLKKSRQEPAPDISKLDLRAPDEWASATATRTQTSETNTTERIKDSPLFVPEDDKPSQQPRDKLPTARSPSPVDSLSSVRGQDSASAKVSDTVTSVISKDAARSLSPIANNPPPVSALIEAHRLQTQKQATNTTELHNPQTLRENGHTAKQQQPIRAFSETLLTTKISDSESRPPVIPSAHPSYTVSPSDDINVQSSTSLSWRRDSLPTQVSADRPKFNRTTTDLSSGVITTMNGRTFKRGEVIVNLRFGDHEVGDVRFTHLEWWASGKILRLKDPTARILPIHFQQRYVMDVATFSVLAQKINRRRHGVGAVEPYADTRQAVESLAEYLEANNLGGIWGYPDPKDQLVFVLYSARAPEWQHLDLPAVASSGSRLHLAILTTMSGFTLEIEPSAQIERSSAVDRDSLINLSKVHRERPQRRLSNVEDEAPTSHGRPTEPHASAITPAVPTSVTNSQVSFSANFEAITCGLDMSQRKPRIFISFARSHPADANAVKEWLSKHLSTRLIFADDQRDDWAEFQQESNDKTSIILFHERYPSYCELPHLYKTLKSGFVFCHSLSFVPTEQGNPITRIFPRGTVLCITESTLVSQAEEALGAMIWFRDSSFSKAQYWKLMLPPDPFSWILRQAMESSGERQNRYLGMLETLHELRTRSFKALWCSSRPSDDPNKLMASTLDEEFVISPIGLPGYSDWKEAGMSEQAIADRDSGLLEYYAGWAVLNVANYRRFMVLDVHRSNKTEKRWCHLWFRDPVTFMQQEKKKT